MNSRPTRTRRKIIGTGGRLNQKRGGDMLEIHSWHDESTGELKIVFGVKNPNSETLLYNFYTDQVQVLGLGQRIPKDFVLTIPWDMTQEVMNALAQWLAKKGVRNYHDAKIEGTLEATRKHLEDLRFLLKIPGRPGPEESGNR